MENNDRNITLRSASAEDIDKIWKMQTEAFRGLLEKYRDYETSPAAEGVERIEARFNMPGSVYYFIEAEGEDVGVIRVIDLKNGTSKRISPLWIMPKYRRKGYAQLAIKEAERIHGAGNWSLDTILQEEGNLHLYEKMGYRRVGEPSKINDNMDIVFYEKE